MYSSFFSVDALFTSWTVLLLQDILLGLLKKLFSDPDRSSRGRRLPLKVVIMSATLETDKLSSFLGDCPVFTIPGRTFPVSCSFGCAVGPKDVESSSYVREVAALGSPHSPFIRVSFYDKVDVLSLIGPPGCQNGPGRSHQRDGRRYPRLPHRWLETQEVMGSFFSPVLHSVGFLTSAGQSEIERACDQLYEKAESIDYRYDVQDETVEGLLILPLYGSMPTGKHRGAAADTSHRKLTRFKTQSVVTLRLLSLLFITPFSWFYSFCFL